MDFDLWYLVLIPLLFLAGWFARGLDARDRQRAHTGHDEEYERALSLLVGQDPQQGVDQLIAIARGNPDAVQLHITLGTLLRERGHFDEAIRVHRFIAERDDVGDEAHTQALVALGQDYLSAGLFDRAEQTFLTLAKIPSQHLRALEVLETIYVTEHAWAQAVDVATQRMNDDGVDRRQIIAHYWCENAEMALRMKNLAQARHDYEQALRIDDKSARAALGLGRLVAGEDADMALSLWEAVKEHPNEYMPLILQEKIQLMVQLGRTADALDMMDQTLRDFFNVDTLKIVVAAWVNLIGREAAKAKLAQLLQSQAKLSVFAQWLKLEQETASLEGPLAQLLPMLAGELKKTQQYECHHCGFLSSTFTWHCLRCQHWASFEVKKPPKPRSY